MPFDRVLRRLVEHYRSFEESAAPPTDSGDIFLDLATSMKGVCRHRAYGFVITAQALGIHARFVQNEAHAWVEVHLPENRGWFRIDLGGAARGLDAHNVDQPAYRPDVPDPLPHPPAYQRAYEQAAAARQSDQAAQWDERALADVGSEGDSESLLDEDSEDQRSGAGGGADGRTRSSVDPSGGTGSERDGRPGRSGAGTSGAGTGSALARAGGDDESGAGSRDFEWSGFEYSEEAEVEERRALELRVQSGDRYTVQRGETLNLRGTAHAGRRPISELRIEVLLSSEDEERLLGVTVTDTTGTFRGSFGVPPDLAVGDYRLIVRSPGNRQVGPAIAY